MSTWQKILQFFYQYKTDILLYTEDGKIKGFISHDDFTGNLSDLESISSELLFFVKKVIDIDQVLHSLEKSEVYHENKKALPMINEKFAFVALWNRVDIIKAWENIDVETRRVSREEVKESRGEHKKSLDHKLAMLAMETLPIGMLALDTVGKQLFYNEDWLALKKKYPRELTTKRIIQNAKNFMAEEVYKSEVNLRATFHLNTIIPGDLIKMRFIRHNNITVGYLFWHPETSITELPNLANKEIDVYEGKSLKEILNEKEKQILIWAMEKAKGKIGDAANILGVPRQTFSYRYDRLHKK